MAEAHPCAINQAETLADVALTFGGSHFGLDATCWDHESVTGDLFDDFLDIYGDIAGGLWLYEREHVEAAVFEWSLGAGGLGVQRHRAQAANAGSMPSKSITYTGMGADHLNACDVITIVVT
nr:hypothetical protein [uncultured Steroidobacter sp.]